MSRVDDIKELRPSFRVDNNTVICRAVKNDSGSTIVVLVTPNDSWNKRLVITTSTTFGYTLKCGDKEGRHMQGLNSNNKFNKVDLGHVNSAIAIQFMKPKTLGTPTDYGTIHLPRTVAGHTIMFFWPNDAPGDHWNHMISILGQAKTVTSQVAGIASNVASVGQDAAQLIALFG